MHHTHFIPFMAQLLLLLPIASVSVLGSTDPMVLSHNALRTEVHSMITALDTLIGRVDETQDSVPKWTIDTLKEWWEKHVGHASDHCRSEQTVYKTLINEKWPDIIDQTQDAMDSAQKKVTKSIAKLSVEKSSLVAMHKTLITYEDMMLKNFGAEERTVLPLLQSNVSPEEMSQIQRKMLEEGHDNAMGALIYALSPDGTKFRNEFMKARNIPSFVWFVAFKGQLSHYKEDMVAKVEAITSGKQPRVKESGWF